MGNDSLMPNDGFNILIDAQIDERSSKERIVTQLKKMQESLAVNIHVQIDPELQKSINLFSKQMERISDASLKQLNITKETVTITKELDGTIQKVSEQYINDLKVNQEIVTTIDKQKQKKRELLDESQKAQRTQEEADKQRVNALDVIGKKLQQVTKLNENLEVTGETNYYRQKGTKTGVVQVNTDSDGTVLSAKVVDSIQKEEDATKKLIKQKENLKRILIDLKQGGQVSDDTLKSVTSSLNTSKTEEDLSRVNDRLNALVQTSKDMTKNESLQFFNQQKLAEESSKLEKFKEDLKKKLLDLRQVAQISESTLDTVGNSIDTSKSRDELSKLEERLKELQKVSKQMSDNEANLFQNNANLKEQNQLNEHKLDIAKRDLETKMRDTVTRYGSVMGADGTKDLEVLHSRLKQLQADTPNLDREIQQLNSQLKQLQSNARASGLDIASRDAKSFGDMLKSAFTKFPIWMVASTAFFQSLRFFSDGIQYVNDLNKSLTQISIVTGQSQAQVEKLGTGYQKLAMNMGVTTKEIAEASVEFYRQGLSQSEVMEKMTVATQYAKISSLGFNEAAKILTATVNSMGVTAERASDVFSYMGDATATGANEIGEAFQKVGGTAGSLGLEFEKVSSWIATVSARTRESAETIGDSFKSILARMASLKENGYNSVLEDGTSANQVQKALQAVGVELIDKQDQFRNFGVVMDELGAKWGGLDKTTRAYVATTVAG